VKIVICNTLYPPDGIGGPERSVKITAEGLVRLGHDVTVIGQGLSFKSGSANINGVKRISIGSPPGYEPVVADNRGKVRSLKKRLFSPIAFDLLARYEELIAAEHPDVVHTNVVHSMDKLWERLHARSLPVVHTVRIYNLMCNERMFFQGAECRTQCTFCKKRFSARIESSNKVSAVVGISRYVLQRHLDEGYFADGPKKFVIGNPYDIDDSVTVSRNSSAQRSNKLLFMGRIHPSKGVRVFASLAKNSPSPLLSYRICGRGHEDYEAEIRTVLQGTPTEWLGFSSHAEAFDSVEWLVVPSAWGEPFGRVVIEAFAHGIPVIASSRGAFPELIQHGKNGFLFSPDDPQSLSDIARGIAEGRFDYDQMRGHALRSAEEFSAQSIATHYQSTYEAVLRKNV